MLFLLAWLCWFHNENKARIPNDDDTDDHNKSIAARNASFGKATTRNDETRAHEKGRQEIVEDDITIFDLNDDENSPYDYDMDMDSFVEAIDVPEQYSEPPPMMDEQESIGVENEKLRSPAHPVKNAMTVHINESTHSKRSGPGKDIDDKHHTQSQNTQHSTFHAELRQPRAGKISLNITPKTKVTIKNNVAPGRIHSIVLKDKEVQKDKDEQASHRVRSVSPAVCIHPENSIHRTHEGYAPHAHNAADSHENVQSKSEHGEISFPETAQLHHNSMHVNDKRKKESAEEITVSVIDAYETNPLDYDEEVANLFGISGDEDARANRDTARNKGLGSAFVPISSRPVKHEDTGSMIPTIKLTVEDDITSGRIPPEISKDGGDMERPRIRSVSPIICIHPESSVHDTHQGVCLIKPIKPNSNNGNTG